MIKRALHILQFSLHSGAKIASAIAQPDSLRTAGVVPKYPQARTHQGCRLSWAPMR